MADGKQHKKGMRCTSKIDFVRAQRIETAGMLQSLGCPVEVGRGRCSLMAAPSVSELDASSGTNHRERFKVIIGKSNAGQLCLQENARLFRLWSPN